LEVSGNLLKTTEAEKKTSEEEEAEKEEAEEEEAEEEEAEEGKEGEEEGGGAPMETSKNSTGPSCSCIALRRRFSRVTIRYRQLCARRKNIQKVHCRKRRVATPNRATPINSFVTKAPPN